MRKNRKNNQSSAIFDNTKMLLSDNSTFSVKEAYKTLRTNVMFSLPESGSKCIGVVSAGRGDGKSSIAINLAIAFSQIKKRAIVVDCDLRLPTVASKIGLEQSPGLSNVLIGAQEFEGSIIRHSDTFGVDVLTSGDIPPDPTTLLGSNQMNNLIELLKKYYDYVILDFPPITMVSDAAILSHLVDGYLIVVRHESSEYQKIAETMRQLNFADAKVIGFVYNGKANSKKYYSKNSRYYYKYYYDKKN